MAEGGSGTADAKAHVPSIRANPVASVNTFDANYQQLRALVRAVHGLPQSEQKTIQPPIGTAISASPLRKACASRPLPRFRYSSHLAPHLQSQDKAFKVFPPLRRHYQPFTERRQRANASLLVCHNSSRESAGLALRKLFRRAHNLRRRQKCRLLASNPSASDHGHHAARSGVTAARAASPRRCGDSCKSLSKGSTRIAAGSICGSSNSCRPKFWRQKFK